MAAKVFSRVVASLPVFVGASMVVFILLHLAPGDPADALLGPLASAEARQELKRELGLDQPLPIQYLVWLGRVVRGDFGDSTEKSVPVLELILSRLKNSLILTLAAGSLAILFAVPSGIIAAFRHNSIIDRLILTALIFAISLPPYWLAVVAIFFFAVTLPWFPTGGMISLVDGGGFLDLLWHITLPAILASLVPGALIARLTRTAVMDTLGQDFVRTAKAKGLSSDFVLRKHILPNALPTIINMTGLQIGYLMVGSAVFVEIVFNWPGLGLLAHQAILARDLPVILGIVLVSAILFVILNLIVDMTQVLLDPRTREA